VQDTANIYEQSPDPDTIGGRLSRAREASGLTVKELAWRLGVRISTINAWESDRSQPDSPRLNKLSGMLNVTISWILYGVGTAPSEFDEPPLVETLTAQLERLKLLHLETGHLIGQIQKDLDGIEAR